MRQVSKQNVIENLSRYLIMKQISREQWGSVLSSLPEPRLKEIVDRVSAGLRIRPKVVPQSGLGMLKMKDSALNESYYLGEFPMSSCWLSVSTENGQIAEGASVIMDDNLEQSVRLALCDAILSAQLPGYEEIDVLLLEGMNRRRQIEAERKSILARTRVDFSLLDDVGDDNA